MRHVFAALLLATVILPMATLFAPPTKMACCENMKNGATCPLRNRGGCQGSGRCTLSTPSPAVAISVPAFAHDPLVVQALATMRPAPTSASISFVDAATFTRSLAAPPDPPPPRA
jgi:hypothetical protein